LKTADGNSISGDDMHWTVHCPECGKEFVFEGYFDIGDETKCNCGCTFRTKRIWIGDDHYIE
jgi:phage terminase large subunit GpA-like protein